MPEMKFMRREVLRLAAMAPLFGLPVSAQAQIGGPSGDNPAHFRFSIGQARMTVLSDGHFSLPTTGIGVNADPGEVQEFLRRHFLSPESGYSHTNHLYIEIGEARVLVDVGSGTRWFSTTGRLLANMAAAGIDPDGITHVIITHAHPDHIWGIRDDFDEAIFPNAQYLIGAKEHGYWMQDGLAGSVAPEDQQFVVGAVNSINVDGVEWTLAQNNHEVVPGIRMIDTPGHTPGHMSVHIESDGKSLIALGDAMTHVWTNFAHPEWYNGIDANGPQTAATRARILDMAAADKTAILGYHFPFPGVGHVMRAENAYRFVPALWQF